MQLDWRRGWIGCTLVFATLLIPFAARADDLCLPIAQGVPGMSNQPPDWSAAGGAFGKQLNDPRWTGATREDFPIFGNGMMPEVAFRGLYAMGSKVYYSLQTLVDDGPTTGFDAVYVGFASGPSSARIVKVTLQSSVFLQGDLTPSSRSIATWQWNGTTWASTGLPDAWVVADPNAIALWVTPPTGPGVGTIPDLSPNTWAVNLAFDTSATSPLGIALGGAVTRIWYQIARYHAAFPSAMLTARHKWPYASDVFNETVALTNDVTKWATLHFGTTDPACPKGVSIDAQNIGTAPDIAAMQPGNQVQWGTPAAANTFEAYPVYPGTVPAAGTLKASFRIADWGSTIGDSNTSWKNIIPPPGTVDSDASGKISWPCSGSACPVLTSGTIPTGPGSVSHQGLLVQLFAGSTAGGGGLSVHFVHDSAWRLVDFAEPDAGADASADSAADAANAIADGGDATVDSAPATADGAVDAGVTADGTANAADATADGADATVNGPDASVVGIMGDGGIDGGAVSVADAGASSPEAGPVGAGQATPPNSGCGCGPGKTNQGNGLWAMALVASMMLCRRRRVRGKGFAQIGPHTSVESRQR